MTDAAHSDDASPAGPGAPGSGARVLLDNRRTPCAVGLIKAARTMADLTPGTVLEIWSRDRFAPMEITLWAERDGHAVQRMPDGGTWPRRWFVFEVTRSR